MTTKHRIPSKKQASKSPRQPKRDGCVPCDTDLPTNLQGLVGHYLKMQNDRSSEYNPLKSLLEGYRELNEIKAVASAIQATELAGKSYNLSGKHHERRHGHQRRITQAAISSVEKKLRNKKWKDFKSFEDLYACIFDACKDIRGIGPLYIYDAALRIGACLDLEPKQVYLHAGALGGAKALGMSVKRKILPVINFPKPIQKLKPHEIEDFLCIFKKELAAHKGDPCQGR